MQNFRALGASPPDPRASGGWGLCPQTPSLRRLGALPPNPQPPAAGGFAPKPPASGGWGLCPQTPSLRRLGALPPNPQPPAAGGFAPKPPASGGWGLRPQTPIGLRRLGAPPPDPQNSPPIANFWLRACLFPRCNNLHFLLERLSPLRNFARIANHKRNFKKLLHVPISQLSACGRVVVGTK